MDIRTKSTDNSRLLDGPLQQHVRKETTLYQILIRAPELGYEDTDTILRNTKDANQRMYIKAQLHEGIAAIKAERASLANESTESAGIITKLRLAFGRD